MLLRACRVFSQKGGGRSRRKFYENLTLCSEETAMSAGKRISGTASRRMSTEKWSVVWRKISSSGDIPVARSSHSMSALGTRVYVYGGEHEARTPIDSRITTCDVSSGCWEEINVRNGTVPDARVAHAQALVLDRHIYIFGGRQGIHMSEAPLNDMHRFDLQTKTWTKIFPSTPPPSARSFHRMVAVGDVLYVFGGCSEEGGRLNDLHAFDVVKKTWTQMKSSDAITGRGGANFFASADGRRLFVVAGYAGKETSDIHVFHIESNEWKVVSLGGHFVPRSVCQSANVGGVLTIFGGEVGPSEKGHEGAGNFSDDLVLLDDRTGSLLGTCSRGDKNGVSPRARGWGAAAAIGRSHLAIFGGLAGNDDMPQRLNDFWIGQVIRQ